MSNETGKTPVEESRFDLQQMLADIELEDRQNLNKKVQQSDIRNLFKNRKKRDDND